MESKRFSVLDMLSLSLRENDSLNLHCFCGRRGLVRQITTPNINRPGLALSGFFESFAHQRVQLFGRGEVSYLNKIVSNGETETLKTLFSYPLPCCVFTHSLQPPQVFADMAEEADCPVLSTNLGSSDFSMRLMRILSNIFAPRLTMHGVLVEVYGLGTLIIGVSGVGKSENALALVERGHRLVADDLVEIACLNGNSLIGRGANKYIGHHMEIRGLGIINIRQIFGVGAIREQKEVQIIVKLEDWDNTKVYDRIGSEQKTMNILGVQVPLLEIPVRPGRNIPIIIETAAMNERLKSMGVFSAKDFNKNVLRWLETDAIQSPYYSADDSY